MITDILSYLDFSVDLICMLPPLDEVEAFVLDREISVRMALGALGVLEFAVILAALNDSFSASSGVVIACCVVILGFIGAQNSMLRGGIPGNISTDGDRYPCCRRGHYRRKSSSTS